jgi:hypothetical protein
MIVWLLMFFALFHCFLNGVAELTRFGDREFYQDFWNAHRLDVFWRKWNILVHEWMLRHIYLQRLKSRDERKGLAMLFVFLFSAIGHEFLFFVIFQKVRVYFFLGMFLQAPLIVLNKKLTAAIKSEDRKQFVGNVFVWSALFIGQPLLELLYIREWLQHQPDIFCVDHTRPFEILNTL